MNLSQIARLQKLKKQLDIFRQNHPKLPAFFDAVNKNALKENSIIEISVTSPDGKNYVTNLKLKESDLEFLEELRKLNQL